MCVYRTPQLEEVKTDDFQTIVNCLVEHGAKRIVMSNPNSTGLAELIETAQNEDYEFKIEREVLNYPSFPKDHPYTERRGVFTEKQ